MMKICKICGKKFDGSKARYNQLCCSPKCSKENNRRKAWERSRRKLREKYPRKICPHCGNLVQLHFDLIKQWHKTVAARCPKCHQPLFKIDNG